MIDPEKLKADARLIALEYMVGHLAKNIYRVAGMGLFDIGKLHADMREQFRKESFGGDPAQSDLMAAEIESAIDRLLKAIEQMTGVRGSHGGTS